MSNPRLVKSNGGVDVGCWVRLVKSIAPKCIKSTSTIVVEANKEEVPKMVVEPVAVNFNVPDFLRPFAMKLFSEY